MPHIRVPLVFPSQKKKMASLKDFICEASAFAKAKFDVINLPTDQLNNFIGEMLLFYKGNLIIENISGSKHVFKATLRLDITDPQDAEEFVQCCCDHNNKTIKLAYTRYDVYFHQYIIMYMYVFIILFFFHFHSFKSLYHLFS